MNDDYPENVNAKPPAPTHVNPVFEKKPSADSGLHSMPPNNNAGPGYYANMPVHDNTDPDVLNTSGLDISGHGDVKGPVPERQLSREQLDQLKAPGVQPYPPGTQPYAPASHIPPGQGMQPRTRSQEQLDQGGAPPPQQGQPMAYQPRTRSQEQLAFFPQGSNMAYMPDNVKTSKGSVSTDV